MGFECSFIKLPRYKDLSPKEVLCAYYYAKFLIECNTEWRKNQIENGYEFSPSDYDALLVDENIPKDDDIIQFYQDYVNSQKEWDQDIIDWWCSSGRYFDDDVVTALEELDTYDYATDIEKISALDNQIEQWLEKHRLQPVTVVEAVRCNDDDTKTCFPVDYLTIEFDDGSMRRVYCGDDEQCLYASAKDVDSDTMQTYQSLHECLKKINDLLTQGTHYVYYTRGW